MNRKFELISVRYLLEAGAADRDALIRLATASNDFFLINGLYKDPGLYKNTAIDDDFSIFIEDLNADGINIARDAYQRYLASFDRSPEPNPFNVGILTRALQKLRK